MSSTVWTVYHKKSHVQWNQNIRGLLSRSLLHLIYYQWSTQDDCCVFFKAQNWLSSCWCVVTKFVVPKYEGVLGGFLVSEEFWHKWYVCWYVARIVKPMRLSFEPGMRRARHCRATGQHNRHDVASFCYTKFPCRNIRCMNILWISWETPCIQIRTGVVESVVQNVSWIR